MLHRKPPTVFVPFSSEVSELRVELESDNRPFAGVEVMGLKVVGLLDSGAQVSILGVGSDKLIRRLQLKVFPTKIRLSTAGGDSLGVIGYVNLPVTFNAETKIVTTLVAPSMKRRLILGMNFWRMFNREPTIHPLHQVVDVIDAEETVQEEGDRLTPEQQQQLDEVKATFRVFVEVSKLDSTPLISHSIEFTGNYKDADPVRLNPYPWSPQVQKHVNEELDKWIESGVVERSNSDWALLIVPVMKKNEEDGEERIKVRMCLDARKLNERTRRDAYPLPHQDRILGRLGASKYLSTIDLSKAFWQIPLEPKSRNTRLSEYLDAACSS